MLLNPLRFYDSPAMSLTLFCPFAWPNTYVLFRGSVPVPPKPVQQMFTQSITCFDPYFVYYYTIPHSFHVKLTIIYNLSNNEVNTEVYKFYQL